MLAIVIAWTTAIYYASLLQCHPLTPFIEAFYGNDCVNGLRIWYAAAISDVIVDFAILLMPIPMVLKLHHPLKQKLAVLGVFLLGAT